MPNQYVISVIEEITRLLAPIGIEPEKDNDAIVASWHRERSWKIDSVELTQKQSSPNLFNISYVVYLLGTDIPRRIFDGMTIEGSGKRALSFLVPEGLMRRFRSPERFAIAVAKKAAGELRWFDEMETPEGCLRKLRTGETNGAGAGGKAFDIIETRLKALVEQRSSEVAVNLTQNESK